MPQVPSTVPVEYPESDGRPMGETDLHRDWMIRILDILRLRYRGRRTYVAGDLLVFYEEGDPKRFVVPDVFVVTDCDPGRRRVFKTWQEARVPDLVVEVTSRSTRREDENTKPQVYARMGIPEYILYDPSGEYLDPPLQGFRLRGDTHERVRPDRQGAVHVETLGVKFHLDGGELVIRDGQTGQALLTEAEAAGVRVAQLEAELEKLHRELRRRKGD